MVPFKLTQPFMGETLMEAMSESWKKIKEDVKQMDEETFELEKKLEGVTKECDAEKTKCWLD